MARKVVFVWSVWVHDIQAGRIVVRRSFDDYSRARAYADSVVARNLIVTAGRYNAYRRIVVRVYSGDVLA